MSDYAPNSGVAEWIALRRAHEGGVANLVGQWFDSGRPVPGYVADALEGLTSGGLLVLADADPDCGELRRVIVTDTGSAHYVTLRQIHNPRATVTAITPHRWACSTHDQRSHLLAQRATDQVGVLVAVCGRRMPWSRGTSAQPTGRQCPTCQALAQVPNPQRHTSPDPGRPPAETAPGGRLDTTAPVRRTADADQNDRPSPTMRQAGLPMPVPQFPTKTPAGRRSSDTAPIPAPGGQPDPNHPDGGSKVGHLRWARCPDDGRLHLLQPAGTVTTGDHAQALCGCALADEGLTLTHGSAGALCLTCLAEIPPPANT